MPIYFYGAVPLTSEDCDVWARMEFWSFQEAILLSMGFEPKNNGPDGDKEEAEKIATAFFRRAEIINRSRYGDEQNQLPCKSAPSCGDTEYENETVYSPAPFTKWAKENFPSFPEELYNAVKDRYPVNSSCKCTTLGSSKDLSGCLVV